MKSLVAFLFATFVFIGVVQYIEAQALCTVASCQNGVCLGPPFVATPVCLCDPGFTYSILDVNICEDFDECKIAYGTICNQGRCVNQPGSYSCQCYPGYVSRFNNTVCDYPPKRQQQQQQQPNSLPSLQFLSLNGLVN
ncbi:fibulin-1-like [Haliotis cracherodii]|uniref:fibulin-1-like n=1 Tax=Haliotis cracherodii TaxID=6455 RepID=UPI0039E86DD2